jgi:hypothetical protein
MNHLTKKGWKVVSENISSGRFKGKTACCYALICLPLGFAAGSTDGEIVVTYEREANGQSSEPTQHSSMPSPVQIQPGPVRYDEDFSWEEVIAPISKGIDSTHNVIIRLADKVPLFRQHKWLLPAVFYLAIAIVSYVVLASLRGGTPNAGY